jgi:hypothetical protein
MQLQRHNHHMVGKRTSGGFLALNSIHACVSFAVSRANMGLRNPHAHIIAYATDAMSSATMTRHDHLTPHTIYRCKLSRVVSYSPPLHIV